MEDWLVMCCGTDRKASTATNPALQKALLDSSSAATRSKALERAAASPTEPHPEPQVRAMAELKMYYKVDWSPQGEIGRGHFASVYKGREARESGGRKVACKRIARTLTRTGTLHNEIKALSACQGHPNIVALYDVFFDDVFVVLVLEYLGGGEVRRLRVPGGIGASLTRGGGAEQLFARIIQGGAYSERDASRHAKGLASALVHMHSRGIVHRDLKPENLVLSEPRLDSPIKISDFGLSKIINDDSDTMKTVCGTRAYSAPEVNFGRNASSPSHYTAKVDVWSLGVILYVILGGYHPFDPFGDAAEAEVWARICRGEWDFDDPVWAHVSDNAKFLLSSMVCVDPALRFDAQQVLDHPWIAAAGDLPSHNVTSVASKSLRHMLGSDVDSTTVKQKSSAGSSIFTGGGGSVSFASITFDEPANPGYMDVVVDSDARLV
jgi:serine/threonine protein kinase